MTGRPTPSAMAVLLAASLATAIAAGGCVPEPGSHASPSPPGSLAPSASAAQVTIAPPTVPPPGASFVRPTPTPMPTFFVYLVHTGDTLTSIARQFRTTARSVAYWNRATYPSLDPESAAYRPDAIKVGWRLQMQPGVTLDEEEVPSLPPGPQPSTEPSAG